MWWIAAAQAATLAEVWKAAEQHAPELSAASAQTEAARAGVALAGAALVPKLQLQGGYTLTDEDVELDLGASLPPELLQLTGPLPPLEVQPPGWWQGSATLSVPLITLDGWASLRAARAGREVAELQEESSRTAIRWAVAQAFCGVYVAREGVRIAEVARGVASRQAKVAERLVAAGAAVPRIVLEARQAELAAERDLYQAVASEVAATEALHRLTGLDRGAEVELGFQAELPTPLDALGEAARRPDVRLAAARVEAARRAHVAASLGWAPDVSARVTGLWTGNPGLADDGLIAQGTVEATWLLDGGATPARARQAQAQQQAALAEQSRAIASVEEELAVTFAELHRARSALTAAEQEQVAAEAALHEAEQAFDQGSATFLEVERASLGVRAASMSAVRERVALELAQVHLVLATGS
jgi:outer membrane protein TolC